MTLKMEPKRHKRKVVTYNYKVINKTFCWTNHCCRSTEHAMGFKSICLSDWACDQRWCWEPYCNASPNGWNTNANESWFMSYCWNPKLFHYIIHSPLITSTLHRYNYFNHTPIHLHIYCSKNCKTSCLAK